MSSPAGRETKELIRELRSKRRRQRSTRTALAAVAFLVVLAGITTGVVLATGAYGADRSDAMVSAKMGASTTSGGTATRSRTPATQTARADHATSTSPDATSTSDAATTSTTLAPANTSTASLLATKVVVIDPGHQAKADYTQEPVGPGSATKKAGVSSGTASPTTGTPESEVTLAVGLKLRAALQALGVKVVMTRTTQDVDITNSERAKIANETRADLAIRLHCDGSTDRSIHGLFTLYPASINGWTDDIAAASKSAATVIQRAAIAATGAQDRGIQARGDLTGFNWSDVPGVLVEMGFMTNAAEDKLLESGSYQDKIVHGLANGILEFLREQ